MQGNPYQPAAPAGVGMPGATPGGGGGGSYEFNHVENQTIEKTAKICRIYGILAMVMGVVAVIGIIVLVVVMFGLAAAASGGTIAAVQGALLATLIPIAMADFAVGFFYLNAAKAFKEVVDTAGNDVQHLMSAVGRLSKAFMIEAIATGIAMVIGFIIGVVNQVGAAS